MVFVYILCGHSFKWEHKRHIQNERRYGERSTKMLDILNATGIYLKFYLSRLNLFTVSNFNTFTLILTRNLSASQFPSTFSSKFRNPTPTENYFWSPSQSQLFNSSRFEGPSFAIVSRLGRVGPCLCLCFLFCLQGGPESHLWPGVCGGVCVCVCA